MFIKKHKYNQLLNEISDAKNYIGILEAENNKLKKDLITSEARADDYNAAVDSLKKRLKHLLQSENIRQYDEHDPKKHTYKKDIKQFDKEINTYKAAYEKLLKCNCCPAITIKQQPLPFERR